MGKNLEEITTKIRELAVGYSEILKRRFEERAIEMQADDKSHYLIYKVLGISYQEGEAIDLYQNKGRFLYRYAGDFLEKATKLCLSEAFSGSTSLRIANPFGTKPKTFEIDCVVNLDAYEIKWRDATTDGDHISKEHSRIKAISAAGYRPIRLMYYPPNRIQATQIQSIISDLYKANNGLYYAGEAAWEHIKSSTKIDLLSILKHIAGETR